MLDPGERAPDFDLAAVGGGSTSLADLIEDGGALLVFVERDCPTSRLTLERLEPLREALAGAGVRLTAVHQDPVSVAARTMRDCGARYAALAEAPPFATADSFGVRTVPTAFLVGRDGMVLDAVEGWCRDDYARITRRVLDDAGAGGTVDITSEPPLVKPGCGAKNTLPVELQGAGADTAEGSAGFDELEDMFERGWTDGLPVVPPTRPRVRRMLGAHKGARSLGPVPPGMGELTLERLAVCAVLAGCRSDYFDVVLAGAEAMLDPAFNLHGMTNTTHTTGAVFIVNGPVRETIEMNSGINAMGGWNRANATIGRALRLVSGLTGQGRPGTLDRSALGQPGKISFCFAENEEASPWEPLSVTRGFEPGVSTVTVFSGDAPFSVSDHYSRDPETVAKTIALAGAAAFSPHVYPVAAETVFVISPEHAATFAAAGWSKRDVAERIFEGSKKTVAELLAGGGEQGPFTAAMKPEEVLAKWSIPDEVIIVVTGGAAGRFSAVLPPWVGYGLGSSMVTRPVRAA
ncbi:MAG: redoxin domain-containing protein [Myxococcales bacterium]|nr:MAG: redoxin domain-containing protein [Myxococcales bacterium]